jgi:hypothetical protein
VPLSCGKPGNDLGVISAGLERDVARAARGRGVRCSLTLPCRADRAMDAAFHAAP